MRTAADLQRRLNYEKTNREAEAALYNANKALRQVEELDFSGYATKAELAQKADKTDLDDYATREELSSVNGAVGGLGMSVSALEEKVSGKAAYTGAGDEAIDPDTTEEPVILTDRNTPGGKFFIVTLFSDMLGVGTVRIQLGISAEEPGEIYSRRAVLSVWSSWAKPTAEN